MSDQTKNLGLPLLQSSQAQKHVTLNEALLAIDGIVQLAVRSLDVFAPPVDVSDGERFIVPADGTGEWVGRPGQIAHFVDGDWAFRIPQTGWRAYIIDVAQVWVFDGSNWVQLLGAGRDRLDTLGVNTSADTGNRLAVKSDAVLFSHDDLTPGSGDMRGAINKATPAQTASLVFQSAWSGRAECGLLGSDHFRVKVSADGADWKEAVVIDKDDASARFPGGLREAESGAVISSLILTPGGTGEVTIWRFDAPRTGLPRRAIISGIMGDKITLTEMRANEFFTNASMEGVSYVRVWNQSRSPEVSAWLRRGASTSSASSAELFVTDAEDIAGWGASDILRLGEPVGGTVTSQNVAAVDISPMMNAQLGAVVSQAGIMVSMTASTNGTTGGWTGQVAVSADASSGSFSSTYTPNDGALTQGFGICAGRNDSPISNCQLIYVRELDDGSGAMKVGAVSVQGLYI